MYKDPQQCPFKDLEIHFNYFISELMVFLKT